MNGKQQTVPVKDTCTTLADETETILKAKRDSGLTAIPDTDAGFAALCLSGGGIRSASFSLGVLQSLAKAGLLGRFDYLSTVSGGGYIGCWLQTLMHYRGFAAAERELRDGGQPQSALRSLRGYTNFLTPNPGLFSADVWTDVVLYLRNVLLNWIVILPLLLLVVIAPILMRTVVWAIPPSTDAQNWLLLIAGLCAAIATFFSALGLPNHRLNASEDDATPTVQVRPFSTGKVTCRILVPFALWWALVPAAFSDDSTRDAWSRIPWIVVTYFAAIMLGYVAAAITQSIRSDPNRELFWANLPAWLIACAVSTGMIWLGVLAARAVTGESQDNRVTVLIIAAPIWLAVSNALHSAVFVGLRRDGRLFDMDREWLARLSAMKLRLTFLWSGLCFGAVGLPALVLYFNTEKHWALLTTPMATGPLVAWVGKKVRDRVGSLVRPGVDLRRLSTNLLLSIGGAVFAAALTASLGLLMQQYILGTLQDAIHARFGVDWDQHRLGLLAVQAGVALVLVAIIGLVIQRVNVNRFSLHALYRNRLTRAFLGSAHARERQPDDLTNFDPNDNFSLANLREKTGRWPLFPVLNMTLNLTTVTRTDWAERKAASFFATPLASGSSALTQAGMSDNGVFVPTAAFGGREDEHVHHKDTNGQSRFDSRRDAPGLSIATAMTISGAAVSPSWGYHSSPLTAFLMALFNARLGAWLPNPAVVTNPEKLVLGRPPNAMQPLVGDLLGRTTGNSLSIYLSDGGHFENLGIYEMLRRRCRLILVVDGGQDGICQFEDLGNAIRKARIDLAADITFDKPYRIYARNAKPEYGPALGFAVGRVNYLDPAPTTGLLLYIKPSILPDMPADALSYALMNKEFPHESTLDQWFSESQFESYRSLGTFQMNRILAGLPPTPSLDDLFHHASCLACNAPEG